METSFINGSTRVGDASVASAAGPQPRVRREPLYFQHGQQTCFGWFHTADGSNQKDCVALICSPLGSEYVNSHRSVRHLADRLARQGVPSLRFDYQGTGDSVGTDLDADRWECWQRSVRAAVRQARELSGRTRVCLIGIRLGATLAALAAGETPIDLLVLWNPCVSGRKYLRELQAIAMTGERGAEPDAELESAGFVMSRQTIESVRAINLLNVPSRVTGRILVVGRDDLAPDPTLPHHLGASGVACDSIVVSGYAAMMDEPHLSVVPEAALQSIVEWVGQQTRCSVQTAASHGHSPRDQIAFPFCGETDVASVIDEQLCRFGAGEHLFGILSRAAVPPSETVIVLFNAGSVHHVGPHRLYVSLARNLAAMGVACFRFDLEGTGDSILRCAGRENHPYPDTAQADARAALEYLKRTFGYRRFIVVGLCSGAHTAFHAGLTLDQDAIPEVTLINPLTFYWVEGMSLATSRHFKDVQSYRKSVRTPASWRRALRGKVDFLRLLWVALTHQKIVSKAYYEALRESLLPNAGPRLSQDLKKLFALKRHVTIFVSEGDPGRDILMAGAKRTALQGQKTGDIHLHMIPGADHTFSRSKPRQVLIDQVCALLSQQVDRARKVS